jgi:hypothetical protein
MRIAAGPHREAVLLRQLKRPFVVLRQRRAGVEDLYDIGLRQYPLDRPLF